MPCTNYDRHFQDPEETNFFAKYKNLPEKEQNAYINWYKRRD